MRVLLVSTYELGHQPLHVASPAAALRAAGHDVACLDLSVEPWAPERVASADAVAFSVPMHTAMRLALRGAKAVRDQRPELPICLFGLYAPVSRDRVVGRLADRVIAGEYEPALVAWVDGLAGGPARADTDLIQLGPTRFSVPARDLLPPLDRYARLDVGGERRLVGYTEASHGCAHECRHCPLPTVYGGRVRLVDRDTVLADVAQQVADGARHITFGDPDFLNGWRHALRVVEAVAERFPDVTFDATVKVEHVLRHADLWPRFAAAGCLFVVTAMESMDDATLARLDKGHTAADAARAVAVLRAAGIEPRPSFMPFTPWTTAGDLVDILDFVIEHDLIGNVDPVQYTIRLLLPEGSLLLDHPDLRPHLGAYDADRLTYRWAHPDPGIDRLQQRLADLVERHAAAGDPIGATFLAVNRVVREHAVGAPPAGAGGQATQVPPAPDGPLGLGAEEEDAIPAGSVDGRPRLTEPWFC